MQALLFTIFIVKKKGEKQEKNILVMILYVIWYGKQVKKGFWTSPIWTQSGSKLNPIQSLDLIHKIFWLSFF